MTDYSPSQVLVDYWTERTSMLYGIRQGLGPTWYAMFTGDSRADACMLPMAGNAPLFSAGLPGGDIRDGVSYIPGMVRAFGPRVVVVQLGLNLAWVPLSDPRWQTISGDYAGLLAALKTLAPGVIATTIIMPEITAAEPAASTLLRAGWLANININIRNCAASQNVQCVDLAALFTQADGTSRPGTTWDGKHFVPATYAIIGAAIAGPIASVWA